MPVAGVKVEILLVVGESGCLVSIGWLNTVFARQAPEILYKRIIAKVEKGKDEGRIEEEAKEKPTSTVMLSVKRCWREKMLATA